jgi:hypothetical protein
MLGISFIPAAPTEPPVARHCFSHLHRRPSSDQSEGWLPSGRCDSPIRSGEDFLGIPGVRPVRPVRSGGGAGAAARAVGGALQDAHAPDAARTGLRGAEGSARTTHSRGYAAERRGQDPPGSGRACDHARSPGSTAGSGSCACISTDRGAATASGPVSGHSAPTHGPKAGCAAGTDSVCADRRCAARRSTAVGNCATSTGRRAGRGCARSRGAGRCVTAKPHRRRAACASATCASTRAAAASAETTGAVVRLGESRRCEAVCGVRRHRARDRCRVVPGLFDAAGMAAAAGARHDRPRSRGRAARRLRDEGGAQVPRHGERAGCCRHRDPLLDLLRGARPLEPDSHHPHLRAAGRSHGAGGPVVDSQGVALHRGTRAARRLCSRRGRTAPFRCLRT